MEDEEGDEEDLEIFSKPSRGFQRSRGTIGGLWGTFWGCSPGDPEGRLWPTLAATGRLGGHLGLCLAMLGLFWAILGVSAPLRYIRESRQARAGREWALFLISLKFPGQT